MITNVDGQNELLQSLRKQLEATEQELASQKWLFERFLESPSWRMTYPIRWAARQVRRVRHWLSGRATVGAVTDHAHSIDSTTYARSQTAPTGEPGLLPQLKEVLTTTHRAT